MKHLISIRKPVGKKAGRGIPCLLISKGTSPSAHCWELKSAFISLWNSKLSSCLVCLQLRHTLQGRSQINSHFDFLGFPGGSAGKESTCNVGDLGSFPGLVHTSRFYHALLTWLVMEWSHSSYILVTWLIMHRYVNNHALFTWLIVYRSRE